MKTKVSRGWRIVIPKDVRKRFGLKEGDEIKMEIKDRKIVLKPASIVENPVERLYGMLKVKPEASPKKVAREWMRKKIERS